MIQVVATIQTHAGQRASVIEQLARVVPSIRAEAGCLLYAPLIDLETNLNSQAVQRNDVITVIEQWESLECWRLI